MILNLTNGVNLSIGQRYTSRPGGNNIVSLSIQALTIFQQTST